MHERESSTEESEFVLDAKVPRRDFLKTAVKTTGLILAGSSVAGSTETLSCGIDAAIEQDRDWGIATLPNKEFFAQNYGYLQNLTLGASYAPEEWGVSLETMDTEHGARQYGNAFEGLKVIVEELGIKDIRLGIRWSNVIDRNGSFDLRFYQPVLDYCIENGVNLCLNVGIKVFRWPEVHIPAFVLNRLRRIPKEDAVLRPGDEIAQSFLETKDEIFSNFKSTYSASQQKSIQIIQPENEPFVQFGEEKWTVSPNYLRESISLCSNYFPQAKILANNNCWNLLDQPAMQNLLGGLIAGDQTLKDKLIYGIDYYFAAPAIPKLPFFQRPDTIALSQTIPLLPNYQNLRKDAKAKGYKLEITEGQAEPWGDVKCRDNKLPGDSAPGFRYMVYRTTKHILGPQPNSVIRIWGAERLAKKIISGNLEPDHREIIELTQMVNQHAV